jgi:peptide methionine sulfoxide reductase msrA/msrB
MELRAAFPIATFALAAAIGLAWQVAPHLAPSREKAMSTGSPRYSAAGYDITPLTEDRVKELAARLTPEQYRVTQRAGTEAPFCGTLADNKKEGTYTCVVCGLPLFSSEHKFHSGTGWPSFYLPFDKAHIAELEDQSHGMVRTEIRCARCGAHLGHVFDDGPQPSGLRYCLNSASLTFVEKGQALPPASQPAKLETAYFAGGCFWGIEHAFSQLPGVVDAESGYQNGHLANPTYRQVGSDTTGHAESVKVVFDPAKVSYEKLVRFFFLLHDPTTPNRQGPDVGSQYRTAIFTTSESQKTTAEWVVREIGATPAYRGRPIVTAVESADRFWPAEELHQDYIAKTGRACHVSIGAALEAAKEMR